MRKIGKGRLRLSYLFLGLLVVAACDNGSEPRVPTRLEIVSGDGQTAQVASVVPVPPTVRVLDRKGKPVRGVDVVFTVSAGGGSITTATATTDANGRAQAVGWTLGTAAGLNTLTVTSPAMANVSVVFTATGGAGAPVRLQVNVQPANAAQSRIPLSTQPVVQVVDQYGNAVGSAGVVVSAQATGVTLQNAQVSSDATGAARFSDLTLTGRIGTYTLRFTAPGLAPIDATATVLSAGVASRLMLGVGFPSIAVSGNALTPAPVIEIQDLDDNLVTSGSYAVSVSLESGTGSLSGGAPVVSQNGRATFSSLSYSGTGAFRLRFRSPGLSDVVTSDLISQAAGTCATTLNLNYTLGQMTRYSAAQPGTPQCLQFDLATNRDQQYLVLFESVPATGDYTTALFPGVGNPSSGITVTLTAAGTGGQTLARAATTAQKPLPAGMLNAWDFGAGPIYEYQPPAPAAGVPGPMVLQRGRQLSLNSAAVEPVVGDTIVVYLANIDRLGIPAGNQRAVIRYVSNELVIAEDTRLGTLTRQNGMTNQPLPVPLMDSIAKAYAAESKRQADMLFNGRYNSTTEVQTPPRIIAVHTLMPADNVWGYTYSSTNVFAWDFWVGTNGSTRGPNQHPLRNAHNLFMHEIAHTRHWGLVERSGQPAWGNMWLIEGFARFSERLPIASYLLHTPDPSRTGNVILPMYSEWAPSYFRDDVPTFLNASSSFLGGYQQSSYIFDYLADQVAGAGGNWRTALTTFLTAAGSESSLDVAINSLLPGLTFRELLTRARIALYTDDLGPPLPSWTQYLQFQLRASRPPGSSGAPVDPRTIWPRVVPGVSYVDARLIPPGAAFGYLIDGVAATGDARITLSFPATAETGISITRVR